MSHGNGKSQFSFTVHSQISSQNWKITEWKEGANSLWWRMLQPHYRVDNYDPEKWVENLGWSEIVLCSCSKSWGLWRQVTSGVLVQEHPTALPGPWPARGYFPAPMCIVGILHSSWQNPYKDFLTCRIRAMGRSLWKGLNPSRKKLRAILGGVVESSTIRRNIRDGGGGSAKTSRILAGKGGQV